MLAILPTAASPTFHTGGLVPADGPLFLGVDHGGAGHVALVLVEVVDSDVQPVFYVLDQWTVAVTGARLVDPART